MRGTAELKIVKTGQGSLAPPPDMLPEIVRPDALTETDPRQWVPRGGGNYSLPLCLNVSEGYWVHLLRATEPGIINRHRHTSPVHLITLKGHWHYPEKDWVAAPGTYVFEAPGDVHTLCVPEGGAEMAFMANVRGALLYVDEEGPLRRLRRRIHADRGLPPAFRARGVGGRPCPPLYPLAPARFASHGPLPLNSRRPPNRRIGDGARMAKSAKKKSIGREGALTRQDWIDAAREMLIESGIERVKVEPLAEHLGVSRGSFYWHFRDRKDLLDQLIAGWLSTALEPMRAVAGERDLGALERFEKFMRVWVQGEPYCPIYDLAIRRWAQVSKDVSKIVKKTDNDRIALLAQIFRDMGHEPDEAFIRARIAYFHQVGYYATDTQESTKQREKFWPIYSRILSGR